MKIKKILAAILSALMTLSCISMVGFAKEEEAVLSGAIEPLVVDLKTTGAKDQRCTSTVITDDFGRSVRKVIPTIHEDSNNGHLNAKPAWIANDTETNVQKNSGNAYKYIKVVYYPTQNGSTNTVLGIYRNNGGSWSGTGRDVTPVVGNKKSVANQWQTVIFAAPEGYHTTDWIFGFMFGPYGTDAVSNHLNDPVYIGYVALFDTLENAQAHVSDFEGALNVSAIKVGGTEVAGFDAATTTYNVDLAGADVVPAITLSATGNTDGVVITKSDVDLQNGTATATVNTGAKTYTINFTNGAKATGLTPIEMTFGYKGVDQGVAGVTMITDEFGREFRDYKPKDGNNNNGVYRNVQISPGGDFGSNVTGDYKVMKIVYRTSESFVPTLSSNTKDWKKCSDGVAFYDVTPAANKWNVIYFNLYNTNGNIHFYQVALSRGKATEVMAQEGAYHQIAYGGLFGSLAEAKAHKTIFEGDLAITSVKIGGEEIGTGVGTYSYDAKGASSVPEITLAATGNTNNVVINKGTFDKDGNATATVKNGSETLITINVTGGEPMDVTPVEIPFEWNGYGNGMSSVDTIVDEFSRTYKQYNPLGQYYENGQDKFSNSAVGPGGNISSHIPADFTIDDYSVVKLVYYTSDEMIPTLTQYTADIKNKNSATVSYDTAPQKNKWNVVYYSVKALPVYQLHFTTDLSSNHPDGIYRIAYAAFFPDMDSAKAHKSAFEGEFAISDVLLGGESIGNVTTYTKNLAGAGAVPKLTVVATGVADGVEITNGTLSAEGTATSTVKKNGNALVTVNFEGGSTEFKIIDIKVDGASIKDFDSDVTAYTLDLGFAAEQPEITYSFQGIEEQVDIAFETEKEGTIITKYVATLSVGGTALYTLTFNVSTDKPQALINTLYKLQNDKQLTVGYFGGSVTAGTGASNANNTSWRGITRDWLRSTFPEASIKEVNAAIGGTGAIFGVFRADQDLIKEKAPDLVFIEMCVNDSYDGIYGKNEMYVYIESIVQNIYDSNPMSEIVFLITGDYGILQKDFNGTEEYGIPYKEIGAYYNIPVIYVGRELAKTMAEENGGTYPSSTSSDVWKKYFLRTYANNAMDSVHPADAGYAHYANTIIDWMTPNLPTSFVPTADDYKAKPVPAEDYCVVNGKGSLMADATMVNPAKFNKNYLGGYKINTSETKFGGNPLMGYNKGDVISLKFNGSALGMWTWSYGETNSSTYTTGTNITYSIDGGEKKTLYVYRSFANNKIYTLASGLSDGEHTIRIYHDDNKAPLHVYNFLIWGLNGRTAAVDTVPYFDFASENYSVTVGGEAFDFDPATKKYEIPVQLTSGQSYPAVAFNVRSDFYGYALTQANDENNVARLSVDNVGEYTFEFVNGTSIEIKSTTDATKGTTEGKVEFEAAAEYTVQIKKDAEDWANAKDYPAGTTVIEGLEPGKYNVRYVLEDGVFGISKSFTIGTLYPWKNVYFVTTGGTGDGSSSKSPAAAGKSMSATIGNAATYFGAKMKNEDCYIIFVGDVINSSAEGNIDSANYKNLIITAESDAVLHHYTHMSFVKVTENSGKLTFKDINLILGNPNAASGKHNDEIYVNALGNEIEFDNFNIIGFATNTSGQTRTSTMCLNYWGDGRTGATGLGRPITINTAAKTFGTLRATGYNAGDESGDAKFVFNNGTGATIKLGGHVNKETITGVISAEINGGTVSTLILSGDTAIINAGSVIGVVNGGTVSEVKVSSDGNTNESSVDRVLILNNGTTIGTLNKSKIDYILRGGVGGKAEAVTSSSKRVTGFTFTTEKETVVINKDLASEKIYVAENGKVTLTTEQLPAGDYTVTYQDIVKPEGQVELKTTVKLGRDAGKTPKAGNELKLVIMSAADDTVLGTVVLEGEDAVVDSEGNLEIEAIFNINDYEGDSIVIQPVKTGYFARSFVVTKNTDEVEIAEMIADSLADFDKSHGDIKGSFDALCGDGEITLDDFIRVLRGFANGDNADAIRNAVDLNEDGVITVADLSIVKTNFGFDAFADAQ